MQSFSSFVVNNIRWLGGGFLLTFFSSFGQTFFISLSNGDIRETFGLVPLVSGLILWTRCMTLILLGSKRFAAFGTRAGGQCHAARQ